ncbi:carboxypeptidase-like regulatory domain-containing protein [Robiginitalea sp. M366]|uniref:carboxypeptidase-like regulatory domain-containing protein n=1 Tax=Robiginitalea aestuariiviva TaxID=3036903 RepID=UPI00240DB779|nr:carboxypeptidase-like regulatory domain-containing protein [Robiginitalea aestuariiviva]MDG1572542.1 carboxypeptidase-like regulatory domain-containing protein [Robiginitalea aestuariiviva]
MKRLMTLIMLGCLAWYPARSQEASGEPQDYRALQGVVVDSQNGDPLVFASLALEGQNLTTVTNAEGEFLLKVPPDLEEGRIVVTYLGYRSRQIPLSAFGREPLEISLSVSVTSLPEVNVAAPADATQLVKDALRKKGENYLDKPVKMTAFYRETIKKRRRNASLAEAVVQIYKAPYTSDRQDAVELYKARKSTDYSRLDTVALKLQGGPFNALFVDVMKYPDYLLSAEYIDDYQFFYERNTTVDDRLVYVIGFRQRESILEPMFRGRLYIDAERKVLTSAIYSLNITDEAMASRMFVRRKPANVQVTPTQISYRVDYREQDGRWYYSYSNALLEFKVDWDRRLFNSVYSLSLEMAVTDWEPNPDGIVPRLRDRVKSSIILSDAAEGFSDPDFWGEYNIIEPDKSIESAIRKIQRQLRREDRR